MITARQDMIQRVLASDPELCARETRGLVMSTRIFMIEKSWIVAMRKRELYRLKHNAQVLHMGIDPSGGRGSDYSVCTIGAEEGRFYIAGMELTSTHKDDAVMKMLDKHVVFLRKFPEYKDATIFLYVEANMSWITADRICEMFARDHERYGMVVPVSEGNGPGNGSAFGVWTGPGEKESYATGLRYTMSDGALSYAEHMSCTNPTGTKQILEEQMSRLRQEVKTPVDPAFQSFKIAFTGKAHNVRDDLCMSLQIALHGLRKQRASKRFIGWATQHGFDRI